MDEEVAASLREAGVSEHDIMLALRQAQDEQVAMKVQKEEWRSGGGTVNLTNNSRHRPRGQGSDTSVDSHISYRNHRQRPADIDVDSLPGRREKISAGQHSPLSSLLARSVSHYGDNDGVLTSSESSPGLERARRSFHERLHDISSRRVQMR